MNFEKKQSDEPNPISPLHVDGVAICHGCECEQFDRSVFQCKLAGVVNDGTACPVWYKRRGEVVPPCLVPTSRLRDWMQIEREKEARLEEMVNRIEERFHFAEIELAASVLSLGIDLGIDVGGAISRVECREARRKMIFQVLNMANQAGFVLVEKGGS